MENLNISNASVGIQLWISHYITIVNSTLVKNSAGIEFHSSSNNTINGNNITNHKYGIDLYYLSNSIISGNNITKNNYGIYLNSSSFNRIYHNNFIDNIIQVKVEFGSVNSWDDGSKGNYWSDYKGKDGNRDGIGDEPYIIDKNNIDRCPILPPKYTVLSAPDEEASTHGFEAILVIAGLIAVAYLLRRKN